MCCSRAIFGTKFAQRVTVELLVHFDMLWHVVRKLGRYLDRVAGCDNSEKGHKEAWGAGTKQVPEHSECSHEAVCVES